MPIVLIVVSGSSEMSRLVTTGLSAPAGRGDVIGATRSGGRTGIDAPLL
ncbi:hypothetical protein ACH4OY_12585 [Micromonospora rubida]|uniref:Uncharacterized protein n=1 Tax=Micromonospora rubida TaxID=2697657 RepID=A0ABW7SIL1_9ACTN